MSSFSQQKNTCESHEDVDPNDPYIQQIVAWAIARYNGEKGIHEDVLFKKTLKAARQCISTRYFIDLEASGTESRKTNKYVVQVLEQVGRQTPTRKIELFAFKGDVIIPFAD